MEGVAGWVVSSKDDGIADGVRGGRVKESYTVSFFTTPPPFMKSGLSQNFFLLLLSPLSSSLFRPNLPTLDHPSSSGDVIRVGQGGDPPGDGMGLGWAGLTGLTGRTWQCFQKTLPRVER